MLDKLESVVQRSWAIREASANQTPKSGSCTWFCLDSRVASARRAQARSLILTSPSSPPLAFFSLPLPHQHLFLPSCISNLIHSSSCPPLSRPPSLQSTKSQPRPVISSQLKRYLFPFQSVPMTSYIHPPFAVWITHRLFSSLTPLFCFCSRKIYHNSSIPSSQRPLKPRRAGKRSRSMSESPSPKSSSSVQSIIVSLSHSFLDGFLRLLLLKLPDHLFASSHTPFLSSFS